MGCNDRGSCTPHVCRGCSGDGWRRGVEERFVTYGQSPYFRRSIGLGGPFSRLVKCRARILIFIGPGGSCFPSKNVAACIHIVVVLCPTQRWNKRLPRCLCGAAHGIPGSRETPFGWRVWAERCRTPSKKGTVECRIECSFAAYSETSHSIAKGLPLRFHGSHESATDLNIAP